MRARWPRLGEESEAPVKRFPWSLDDILSGQEIWMCASCFTCIDKCPRDVGFTNISIALRNLAARAGNIPLVFREQANTIYNTGLAYKIPMSRLRMREKQGLPPLPEINAEQVKALLDATGLLELVKKAEGAK